jgi:hypothetical protein
MSSRSPPSLTATSTARRLARSRSSVVYFRSSFTVVTNALSRASSRPSSRITSRPPSARVRRNCFRSGRTIENTRPGGRAIENKHSNRYRSIIHIQCERDTSRKAGASSYPHTRCRVSLSLPSRWNRTKACGWRGHSTSVESLFSVSDHPARVVEAILQALVLHQLVALPVQSCGVHRLCPAHVLRWCDGASRQQAVVTCTRSCHRAGAEGVGPGNWAARGAHEVGSRPGGGRERAAPRCGVCDTPSVLWDRSVHQ